MDTTATFLDADVAGIQQTSNAGTAVPIPGPPKMLQAAEMREA